jgi:hypothetical protein
VHYVYWLGYHEPVRPRRRIITKAMEAERALFV